MSTAVRDQMKSAIDANAEKARNATDWLGDHAEAAEQRAKSAAHSFAHTVSRAAEPVRNMVEDGCEQGKKAVNHIGEDATVLIRNYPLAAVAAGFAVGLLMGRIAAIRV